MRGLADTIAAKSVVHGHITARELTIEGDVQGSARLEGGKLRIGTVKGQVSVAASEVTIDSIKGEEGTQALIVATETVNIRRRGEKAIIVCRGSGDAAVVVGADSKERATPQDPVVTFDSIALAECRPSRPQMGSAEALLDVEVQSGGGVVVFGSATNALIEAKTAAIVLGRYEWARREQHSKPIIRSAVGYVGGELDLGGASLHCDQWLSAPTVRNGYVSVGNVVATKEIHGSYVASQLIGVSAQIKASNIVADGLLRLDGGTDSLSSISVGGDCRLEQGSTGSVTWTPDEGDKMNAAGNVAILQLVSNCLESSTLGRPKLSLTSGADVGTVWIGGAVEVEVQAWESKRTKEQRRVIGYLEINESASINLRAQEAVQIGTVALDGTAQLTSECPILSLSLSDSEPGHRLSLDTDAEIHIIGTGGVPSIDAPPVNQPALSALRGTYEISTAVRDLRLGSEPGDEPLINIARDGLVVRAVGRFFMNVCNGRMRGGEGNSYVVRRTGRFKEEIGDWWTSLPLPFALRSTPHTKSVLYACPAQLLGTHDGSGGPGNRPHSKNDSSVVSFHGGHLVGIDVSGMPYGDLSLLSDLHVFEPDSATLMAAATVDAHQDELRLRAQRLKDIAEIVGATASSGGSRSAALWASARSHHAAIRGRFESSLRVLHRAMGYGQRPAPALLTMGITVTLIASSLLLFEGDPTAHPDCSAFEGTNVPKTLRGQIVRVLLMPASLLRLGDGGAPPYPPIACSAGWHTLGFLTVGLVLIFSLIAIRNFLRTPADR